MENKQMNPVIVFHAGDQDFPLEIIDKNDERWVTRKQLACALGVSDLHKLHGRLIARGELKENIHFSEFRDDMTRNSGRGNPNTLIYSYRGVIRVAMASEGVRAVAFRDWAEDVLYAAMTGSAVSADIGQTTDLQKQIIALQSGIIALQTEKLKNREPVFVRLPGDVPVSGDVPAGVAIRRRYNYDPARCKQPLSHYEKHKIEECAAEGMNDKKIADILGRPVSTVYGYRNRLVQMGRLPAPPQRPQQRTKRKWLSYEEEQKVLALLQAGAMPSHVASLIGRKLSAIITFRNRARRRGLLPGG